MTCWRNGNALDYGATLFLHLMVTLDLRLGSAPKISKSLEFLENRRGNPEFEIFGIAKDLTISLVSLEIQPS